MATPRLCSDIQLIDKTECIGNSLVKINRNFSSLRSDICSIVNDFNPLINITGLVKGTGSSLVVAVPNVDYYKPNTTLQYPLTITGALNCLSTATVAGDTTLNSNLTVGSASRLTSLRMNGDLRIKDFASTRGILFTNNQINASPENPNIEELALNYTGYNAGITQFRNLTIYNGKKQQLMSVDGSTGKVVIGSPGSKGDLLTIYGSISATGIVYGGSINTSINTTSLSAPGANDGDVLTYVVRNVITNNPTVTNPVTTKSTARFYGPYGIAADSRGYLYVGDTRNNTIREISPTGAVTTIAGLAGQAGSTDGQGSNARFRSALGLIITSNGIFYIADHQNHTIRRMDLQRNVSTVAGIAGQIGSSDGIGTAATFHYLHSVNVDSLGNIYVSDRNNHTIRKISPTGVVSTFAGLAGNAGSVDGTGSVARFNRPTGIAIDSLNNLYICDIDNHTIRKVTPAGVVTTIAGLAGQSGIADGTGANARFNSCQAIDIDRASGNFYIADSNNHTIRKMTPTGVVTTVGGIAGVAGTVDGVAGVGKLNIPAGIAVGPSGDLYITDYYNHTIRKLTPSGAVSTIAGVAGQAGSADGLVAITDLLVGIPLVRQVGSWVPKPMTIELPSVANNKDVLTYNSATNRWTAAAVPGDAPNSITLDKLSIAGAAPGNIISYNTSTMQWAPSPAPSTLPTPAASLSGTPILAYDTTTKTWVVKELNNVIVPTTAFKKNEISTTANVATYILTVSADSNPENYLVYLNGVMQSPGTDYTISSNGRITLIPAPAGSLKLTVMAMKNVNGAVTGTGTSITNTTIVNDKLSPGAEGQVLTYTSSAWKGVNPSVLPSQIQAGGATGGQILSYNGTNWVPTTYNPSINPVQIQQAGAKNGQVLMFNASTNTWAASSLPKTTTTNTTIINDYDTTPETNIYKLCERNQYNNSNEFNDGFGFIDSTGEVRVIGTSAGSRFGPYDIVNVLGYGTLPLPNNEFAEKLYIDGENVLVITKLGNVYISGRNTEGQCAQGPSNLVNQPTLVKAQVLSNITQIAHGASPGTNAPTFFAISSDGRLYSWGWNQYGAVGDNTTVQKATPVQTLGPGNAYGNSTQKVIQVIAIPGWDGSSTPTTAGALLEDGSVWCVGYGGRSNLGDGNTNSVVTKWVRVKTSPTNFLEGIKKICGVGCAGYSTMWALDVNGVVWAWGRGSEGQIGDQNNVNRSYATQMYTGHLNPKPVIEDFCPVAGGANQGHSIFLRTANLQWYACGGNTQIHLGLGPGATNRNKMELISTLTGKGVQYITSMGYGGYQSFAVAGQKLYSTGTSATWGSLGLGHINDTYTFTEVRLKTNDPDGQLDVRPIHAVGAHLNTYVFSTGRKKLYMAGGLAYDTQAGARYVGWKIRTSFQEVTRSVV